MCVPRYLIDCNAQWNGKLGLRDFKVCSSGHTLMAIDFFFMVHLKICQSPICVKFLRKSWKGDYWISNVEKKVVSIGCNLVVIILG